MYLGPIKISPYSESVVEEPDVSTTYIMLGQSNMGGNANIATLQAEYVGSNPNVQIWNGSAYEAIDSTTNNNQFPAIQQNNTFAVEFAFGKRLSDGLAKTVYLQKYAIGGSFLRAGAGNDWNTASVGEYYDISQGIITSAGDLSNLKAVVWIQGEADSTTEAEANLYYANLTNFINGFRTFTGIADLKFIIVLVNDNLTINFPYNAIVRKAMLNIKQDLSNIVTINPNALELKADETHYVADSYEDLGELIALEEQGTSQTQTFDNMLNFRGTSLRILATPRANIDASVVTGVRPTFTIHAVYRVDFQAPNANNLCGLWTDSSNRSFTCFGMSTLNKIAKLTLYSSSGVHNISSNFNAISEDVWYSVSFVIDGTDSKIYVNKVDETASVSINNTATYGQGDKGTSWAYGNYSENAPVGDSFKGKIATWGLIDYAISKAEHDSLTGVIANNQINPVKIGSVINPSNIVSLVEDNFSWNGSAIVGIDSWTSQNMVEHDITEDSPT